MSVRELSMRELERGLSEVRTPCQESRELFFPAEGERPRAQMRREREAAALCQECPVRALCLERALRLARTAPSRGWNGVWAGFTSPQVRLLVAAERVREAPG